MKAPDITEATTFAKRYYQRLIEGQVGKGDPFPEDALRGWHTLFKPPYDCYQMDLEEVEEVETDEDDLAQLYSKAAISAGQSFKNLAGANEKLRTLIATAINEEDEEDEAAPLSLEVITPELPAIAARDYSQCASARVWLDDWLNYACAALPGAARIHLEGVGIWVLSALVARRIAIKGLRQTYYPNVYLALTSKPGIGKSVAAQLGVKAIEDLELYDNLILEGNWSPQILTQRAAGKPDDKYADMDDDDREAEKKRMIYSGRQSWFFDEFGSFLLKLNSKGNNQQTQRLAELLLSWYSGRGTSQGSLTYGTDRVKEVYLSIVGCMTIRNLKTMQKEGASFWEDGMFSRIVALCAPSRAWVDIILPDGDDHTPDEILEPLRKLHLWLGEPEADIVGRESSGRASTSYKLVRTFYPEQEILVPPNIKKLYNNYYNAIGRLASDDPGVPMELESTYRRLPEYAIKIAALLAAVGNNGIMEEKHWDAAQQIVDERWRDSAHQLYAQVFAPEDSQMRVQEDKVLKIIEQKSKKGEWVTANDIRRASRMSVIEIGKQTDELERRGFIVSFEFHNPRKPKTPTLRYAIKNTPLPQDALAPK